ncbi:MAG: helix-turn-helix domain-containing protein [Marinosulfonomonas sp.]|nr:helix-turn-helix domain-containing protein [Marinosulfonomonas sp.]
MSSLAKMLSVFDAFTPQTPALSAEEIMAKLGYSRGTAYRYIRELHTAGFLSRVAGQYTLGPRIIELDYHIREADPNLRMIQTVMQTLRDKTECDVLLTSFFENRVVVSLHERGTSALKMSFGRGRAMPLFKGAGSKIILACLKMARQRKVYAAHSDEIAAAGLGNTWEEFRAGLLLVRRTGAAISVAELDPDNVGVAVPVNTDPPGSLVLVFSAARYAMSDKNFVIQIAKEAAEQVNEVIQKRNEDSGSVLDLLGEDMKVVAHSP